MDASAELEVMGDDGIMNENGVSTEVARNIEILLEVRNCRRPLRVTKDTLQVEVENFFEKKLGEDAKVVTGDFKLGEATSKFLYILQKFSVKWGKFMDVQDVGDISEEDCLTAVILSKDEQPVSIIMSVPSS